MRTIILTEDETRAHESTGSDGDTMRAEILRRARELARYTSSPVEILAADECGGYAIEQVWP